MRYQASFLLITGALSVLPSGFAKDKTKVLLPNYILHAKTVAVLIDPNAGVEVSDPQANRVAQKDVETALLKWGRFEPVIDSATADLLIVVRKGNGRADRVDWRERDRASRDRRSRHLEVGGRNRRHLGTGARRNEACRRRSCSN